MIALYVGGMGARGRNFYNDLARRYGFEAEAVKIQDLYLDGKKDEAAAAVPDGAARGDHDLRARGLRARPHRRLQGGRRDRRSTSRRSRPTSRPLIAQLKDWATHA